MTRQKVINGAVVAIMGYAASVLWMAGHPAMAISMIVAWFIGMINSLISE